MSLDFHISPFGGGGTSLGCILEMFSIGSFTCQAKSAFYFPGQISKICKDSRLFQLVSAFMESDVLILSSKLVYLYKIGHLNCGQLSVWWVYVGSISII